MKDNNSIRVAVVGAAGRTGRMFAFELAKAADVLGIVRKEEIETIGKQGLWVRREGEEPKQLRIRLVSEDRFSCSFLPQVVFLTTKNPVGSAVGYYYQKIKNMEKLPCLVLSQNGLSAGKEAKEALERVLGERAKEVQVVRVSLLNPVERENTGGRQCVAYFLPVRLAFGVFSGKKDVGLLSSLFKRAGIRAKEVEPARVPDMEVSKLFLNLIGMASSSWGVSLKRGFEEKRIAEEEFLCLKEYIRVVKAAGRGFINLPGIPLKLLAFLLDKLPLSFLLLFRKKIGSIVSRARGEKEKGNIDEIDYYQGEVVRLGKRAGIPTPIQERILKRARQRLNRFRVGCRSG